jgi:hypothetical protein
LKTKGCLLSSLEDKRLSSFLLKITFCLQGRKEDNLLSSRVISPIKMCKTDNFRIKSEMCKWSIYLQNIK